MRNFIERRRRSEKGFTLIELLVVIVILGILAAVVVFAVGGLNDKGEESACKIDTRTLRTAQEAYFANDDTNPASYASEQQLLDAGFLSELSDLHDIVEPGVADYSADSGTQTRAYDVTVQDDQCGTIGATVGAVGSTAE